MQRWNLLVPGFAKLWLFLLWSVPLLADPIREESWIDELDASVDWFLVSLEVTGSRHFTARELESKLRLRPRAWYQPWKPPVPFDPAQLDRDLEWVRRRYERAGFFGTRIELGGYREREGSTGKVGIEIRIEEGARARVTTLSVRVDDQEIDDDRLLGSLPLREGGPFSEEKYQESGAILLRKYRERGYAHARVERRAEVSADRRSVVVSYGLDRGPAARFGATVIEGLEDVDPDIVERELYYSKGAAFTPRALEQTRSALLALKLFSSIRLEWQTDDSRHEEIPVRIRVVEKPPREIQLGVGYSTLAEFGVRAGWRHYNWLGDGRRLSVSGKYSTIVRSAELDLLQPHLFGRTSQGLFAFRLLQDDEETYTLNSLRGVPRVQLELVPGLLAWISYRVQLAELRDIGESVENALGKVRRDGVVSGPTLGLDWHAGVEGTRFQLGTRYSLRASQMGAVWGGDYHFYTLTADLAHSLGLGWGFELAGRLRLGFADALGSDRNLPLFERLYAGGEDSVRGFGRRELGPKSATGDPLGGRSRLEASVELRRAIWGDLGLAAFFDVGQVSLEGFHLSKHDFESAVGPGLTYETPVGPLSLYVGFPLDPPDEQRWELHFSIGYFF